MHDGRVTHQEVVDYLRYALPGVEITNDRSRITITNVNLVLAEQIANLLDCNLIAMTYLRFCLQYSPLLIPIQGMIGCPSVDSARGWFHPDLVWQPDAVIKLLSDPDRKETLSSFMGTTLPDYLRYRLDLLPLYLSDPGVENDFELQPFLLELARLYQRAIGNDKIESLPLPIAIKYAVGVGREKILSYGAFDLESLKQYNPSLFRTVGCNPRRHCTGSVRILLYEANVMWSIPPESDLSEGRSVFDVNLEILRRLLNIDRIHRTFGVEPHADILVEQAKTLKSKIYMSLMNRILPDQDVPELTISEDTVIGLLKLLIDTKSE
jgi:hypothetical protein